MFSTYEKLLSFYIIGEAPISKKRSKKIIELTFKNNFKLITIPHIRAYLYKENNLINIYDNSDIYDIELIDRIYEFNSGSNTFNFNDFINLLKQDLIFVGRLFYRNIIIVLNFDPKDFFDPNFGTIYIVEKKSIKNYNIIRKKDLNNFRKNRSLTIWIKELDIGLLDFLLNRI